MTDPQPTPDTVTVASQSIELLLTGKPDVKNKWGSGSIQPSLATFTYRQEGIHAHLYGSWVREDGEPTDQPCDQAYRIGDTDEWPDWLADLAREHKPAAVPSAPAPDVVAAIVAALQDRAGELSELAEEQMRPSLEERAQEWHEAADVARRAAKAAVGAQQPKEA